MERRKLEGMELFYEVERISPFRRALDRVVLGVVTAIIRFLQRHWLAIFNWMNGVTFFGVFVPPYLMANGLEAVAQPIFTSYHLICPQRPDHSFFIFGYQMAMEERMVAIYGAMFFAGMVFWALGRNVRPLDTRLFVLLSIPMVVDIFTQTFGWRVSDGFWRSLTGGVFGLVTVWWAYPYIHLAQQLMRRRRLSAGSGQSSEAPPVG